MRVAGAALAACRNAPCLCPKTAGVAREQRNTGRSLNVHGGTPPCFAGSPLDGGELLRGRRFLLPRAAVRQSAQKSLNRSAKVPTNAELSTVITIIICPWNILMRRFLSLAGKGSIRLVVAAALLVLPGLTQAIQVEPAAVTITSGLGTVDAVLGLTTHPDTNDLYAILRFGSDRRLATINPLTGAATDIGLLSDKFSNIAFSATNLYGVTGDGAAVPETLYTLNTSDASVTFVTTLGNGNDGESLAFNPDDGLMYHWSGSAPNETYFESINLSTLAVTPIYTSAIHREVLGTTYDSNCTCFLAYDRFGGFFSVTPAGTVTDLDPLDLFVPPKPVMKGLAFVGSTLYGGSAFRPSTSTLFKINPSNGASVPVVWNEYGEAGESLATSNVPMPSFSLTDMTEINGSLIDLGGSVDDVDLYKIRIPFPTNTFSVRVLATLSGTNDAQLYLFNAAGELVLMDDDSGSGLLPEFSAGSLLQTVERTYYLAFVTHNASPTFNSGVLSGWNRGPGPQQTGPYSLAISGANFAPPGASLTVISADLAEWRSWDVNSVGSHPQGKANLTFDNGDAANLGGVADESRWNTSDYHCQVNSTFSNIGWDETNNPDHLCPPGGGLIGVTPGIPRPWLQNGAAFGSIDPADYKTIPDNFFTSYFGTIQTGAEVSPGIFEVTDGNFGFIGTLAYHLTSGGTVPTDGESMLLPELTDVTWDLASGFVIDGTTDCNQGDVAIQLSPLFCIATGLFEYFLAEGGQGITGAVQPKATYEPGTGELVLFHDGLDSSLDGVFNIDNMMTFTLTVPVIADVDADGVADELDNCVAVANGPWLLDAGGHSQRDSNGDGYGNFCDADLNNDGIINGLDVGPFINQFGTAGPDADFNGDGIVNGLDVGPFIAAFGQAPGPSGVTP